MKPTFNPGRNIAVKVPVHEYEKTVSFYRDIIGLTEKSIDSPDSEDSVCFYFGGKTLWIDKVSGISHAETWLELETDDIDKAAAHLESHGVIRRDEIEPLPEDFKGFWICSPSNTIHLITE